MSRYRNPQDPSKGKVTRSLATLVMVVSMAVALNTTPKVLPKEELDIFGTVTSVRLGALTVQTERNLIEAAASPATVVVLPLKQAGRVADLVEGDQVAVSFRQAESGVVADKVVVIPDKSWFRHTAGQVSKLTGSSIAVQQLTDGANDVIFSRTQDTKVRFLGDAATLGEGSNVVVVAARAPNTGELLPHALEIDVVGRLSPQGFETEVAPALAQEGSSALIIGVFEGINQDDTWMISGTSVALAPDTQVNIGVAAGQWVQIEASMRLDGRLIARTVDARPKVGVAPAVMQISGVFSGVDSQGRWGVGGAKFVVDARTDSDGVPLIGQPVKLKAVRLVDGTLLARQVTNPGGSKHEEVRLQGTLLGFSNHGQWNVDGALVAVGPKTRLQGSPAVGQLVAVKAALQTDGSLLARDIVGQDSVPLGPTLVAQINGVVSAIPGKSRMVVNGTQVSSTPLTRVSGSPDVGRSVKVSAVIQPDLSLIAREVSVSDTLPTGGVNIAGTVHKINGDGTLVVNGILVATNGSSQLKGDPTEGGHIKVEGVLLDNGSILASALESTERTSFEMAGRVDAVNLDRKGNVSSIVTGGLTVSLDPLTNMENQPTIGSPVQITGVIAEGTLVAGKVGEGKATGSKETTVRIEGKAQEVKRDGTGQVKTLVVDGVPVRVQQPSQPVTDGDHVQVVATAGGGTIVATELEVPRKPPQYDRGQRTKTTPSPTIPHGGATVTATASPAHSKDGETESDDDDTTTGDQSSRQGVLVSTTATPTPGKNRTQEESRTPVATSTTPAGTGMVFPTPLPTQVHPSPTPVARVGTPAASATQNQRNSDSEDDEQRQTPTPAVTIFPTRLPIQVHPSLTPVPRASTPVTSATPTQRNSDSEDDEQRQTPTPTVTVFTTRVPIQVHPSLTPVPRASTPVTSATPTQREDDSDDDRQWSRSTATVTRAPTPTHPAERD